MLKLDLKNRKILYELDINSRQPYNEIAKKVGLSKDSIIYRIENLRKDGIIKHFHTVIDVGKLGFISFRLYINFQNTTPEKEKEIIEFFRAKEIVTWLVSIDGEYDIGMWILARSISEVNSLWKEFSEKYVNYADRKWLTIFTHVSYFPRSYLLGIRQNDEEYVFITEPANAVIDETGIDKRAIDEKDLELLKLLAPDSRVSVLELAKKLGLTPKTVATRIRSLEDKKIIVGYRTEFDLGKLGYQYFKLHINLHNTTPERIKSLKAYIKSHPNITYDNEVLGGDDIEIEIQVEDLAGFREIVEDIKSKFSDIIKDHKSMNFYQEHKFLFLPVKI
jgi:DNA-binding Lrp family transcriptional regulator